MTPIRPLRHTALLASLLPAPALAQYPQAPPLQPETTDMSWDDSASTTFRDLASGDFNGNGFVDFVTVRGSELELMLDAPSLGAVHTSFASSDVFTVLDGGGSAADHLLVAGTSGLEEVAYSGGGSFSTTAFSTTTSWANVALLVQRELPGSNHQILGVQSDGVTVRALTDTGSGYVEESSPVFVASSTILRLLPFDRDGDGRPELGVMMGSALQILTASDSYGSETWSVDTTVSLSGFQCIDLVSGSQGSGAKEWAFWLVLDPNGTTQYGAVFDENGYSGGTALPSSTPLYVVRAATGDWDDDGDDDVVLSWRASQELGVYENTGTTSVSFVSSSITHLALSSSPLSSSPWNEAEPWAGDIDFDGDIDLVSAVQPLENLRLRYNAAENAMAFAPDVTTYTLPLTQDPGEVLITQDTSTSPLEHNYLIEAAASWPVDPGTPLKLRMAIFTAATETSPLVEITPALETGLLYPEHAAQSFTWVDSAHTEEPPIEDEFFFYKVFYVSGDTAVGMPRILAYHVQGDPGFDETPGSIAQEYILNTWNGDDTLYDVDFDSTQDKSRVGGGYLLPNLPQPPMDSPIF